MATSTAMLTHLSVDLNLSILEHLLDVAAEFIQNELNWLRLDTEVLFDDEVRVDELVPQLFVHELVAHHDQVVQLVDYQLLIHFQRVKLCVRQSCAAFVKAVSARITLFAASTSLLLQRKLVEVRVLLFSHDSPVLLSASFHVNEGGHHASESHFPVLEHVWLVGEACNYLLHDV